MAEGNEPKPLDSDIAELKYHKLGTAVSINSYSAVNNKYKVPADGYVICSSGTAVGSYAMLYCNEAVIALARTSAENYTTYMPVFVKKDIQVYCSLGTGSNCTYYPLVP